MDIGGNMQRGLHGMVNQHGVGSVCVYNVYIH